MLASKLKPSSPSICIVGAGVAGLTSAYRILEKQPNSRISIVAERYGHDTTTSGAAGVWGPYKMMETPTELVDRLAMSSYRHLLGLFHSPDARAAGVSLVQSYYLYDMAPEPPYPTWKEQVDGLKDLNSKQLRLFKDCPEIQFGFTFDNVTVEGRFYLAFLESKIKSVGGENLKIIQKKVSSLEEIEGYDAVVNCSGLGSRQLMDDELVKPIRGQILRVEAPWITNHINYNSSYIIPNPHHGTVVLGGTGQDSWDTKMSRDDRDTILKGCMKLMPSLVAATVKDDWVGLRPGRQSLRLEIDPKRKNVIHNYGHGGAGLTLGWGCAGDVVDLLGELGVI